MSLLLRAILVVGLAGLVLQGCGQEEAAAPVEAPAAAAPAGGARHGPACARRQPRRRRPQGAVCGISGPGP